MIIPPFVRTFLKDFLETLIPITLAAFAVFPGSLDEAIAAAVLFVGAAGAAAMSAARRAYPDARDYFIAAIEARLFPIEEFGYADAEPESYDVEVDLDGTPTIKF